MALELESQLTAAHSADIAQGQRFQFGKNWASFLRHLDERRIKTAEESLQRMLGLTSLHGLKFIDIGSGSGLFSLAARRLGANVFSFDYDPQSFHCTQELRSRFFPDDPDWRIQHASVLDREYMTKLGTFDIVYSWGVLHHTGQMWQALENVVPLVKPQGLTFIAIYNDQGKKSRRWISLKKTYNRLPPYLRFLIVWPCFLRMWGPRLIRDLFAGAPLRHWRGVDRGMSPWHDLLDWLGGYPFEVAKPEEIFDFYKTRGFELMRLTTQGGDLGCNEFVLRRVKDA